MLDCKCRTSDDLKLHWLHKIKFKQQKRRLPNADLSSMSYAPTGSSKGQVWNVFKYILIYFFNTRCAWVRKKDYVYCTSPNHSSSNLREIFSTSKCKHQVENDLACHVKKKALADYQVQRANQRLPPSFKNLRLAEIQCVNPVLGSSAGEVISNHSFEYSTSWRSQGCAYLKGHG